MSEFSNWDIIYNLLMAARWTVLLSLTAFVLGGLVGLLLLMARTAGGVWVKGLVRCYVELFQGTPLLMQLFIVFFGLPLIGLDISPWMAAMLGLTLFTSAFLTEIWRGCVEAIGKGQWEASTSLGMKFTQQMRYIILPQAMRIAVPPTVGFSVQVVKGTAVASIIGFVELTKAGTMITNATYAPFTVYGFVAVMYFLICYPLSLFARHLEGKFRHVAR
ncbi:amino acid ABC transporter permease [Thalassospira lucentensis]|uniref:Amino acid ABC transporter permease n=1 Tax=Thalassospira lucentensis TaxID=168935 RepID=A0A358HTN3_9PROT|nr:amino acid ABC transporter permease [Thalassospira lucentensis]HBU98533.1 amino acid ABC transporter permease [Thalassospira lucentensis]HCW69420.1 amino acid ABC transporter permease [Thalassospira lucentensis]|tara:strand:- start:1044 stop:1697 length:654 start_codon:yes stop_codon:yes gene_type:complete